MGIQSNTHLELSLVGPLQYKEFLKMLNSNQENVTVFQTRITTFFLAFQAKSNGKNNEEES